MPKTRAAADRRALLARLVLGGGVMLAACSLAGEASAQQGPASPGGDLSGEPASPEPSVAEERSPWVETLCSGHDPTIRMLDVDGRSTPWAVSLCWSQTLLLYTLNRSSQLTYHPAYGWDFTLMPSWTFERSRLTVSATQSVGFELTDTSSQRVAPSDTGLQVRFSGIPALLGIRVTPWLELSLPTSRYSRDAHRILAVSPALSIERSFDALAGLTLSTSVRYTRYVARSYVVESEPMGRTRFYCPGTGGGEPGSCASGFSTIRQSVEVGLGVDLKPIRWLTVSTGFAWLWRFGGELSAASVIITASGDPIRIPDRSDTHLRGTSWFTLGLGFDVTGYLRASASMSTVSPHLDTDGRRKNPIWNEGTTFSLSLRLSIDAAYEAARRHDQPPEP